MFEKTQNKIKPERLISRQHAIPREIRVYAGYQQLQFTGQRGRGRANVPSLCDIYEALTKEGMAFVNAGAKPEFIEVGQPDSCTMARIRFDTEFDAELRSLKDRADSGEFVVKPASEEARQVKQISLISLAINLMQLAIDEREKKGESSGS